MADTHFGTNLPIKLQWGACGRGHIKAFISRRMQLLAGIAKRRGFTAADLTGNQCNASDSDGIIKAVFNTDQLLGFKDIVDPQLIDEGFFCKAKKCTVIIFPQCDLL